MSDRDLEKIEAELLAIRRLLEGRGVALEPMAVTMEEAARLLFCSSKHVSRLVKSGALITAPVGGLRRIPMSEIRRIASVPEVGQRQDPLRRQPRYSAAMVEAEYLKLRGRGKPKKKR